MAPSIFNIDAHTKTYPRNCNAMASIANNQTLMQIITRHCEKHTIHKVLPQMGKQVVFEEHIYVLLWKNSALDMPPSIFNTHIHIATHAHK